MLSSGGSPDRGSTIYKVNTVTQNKLKIQNEQVILNLQSWFGSLRWDSGVLGLINLN